MKDKMIRETVVTKEQQMKDKKMKLSVKNQKLELMKLAKKKDTRSTRNTRKR